MAALLESGNNLLIKNDGLLTFTAQIDDSQLFGSPKIIYTYSDDYKVIKKKEVHRKFFVMKHGLIVFAIALMLPIAEGRPIREALNFAPKFSLGVLVLIYVMSLWLTYLIEQKVKNQAAAKGIEILTSQK